jgi:asparagine synthase (glutamine-hydrolysing)
MCGIAGIVRPRGEAAEAARAMHARLAHRGPDAEGIETLPGALLCHRRLSIIDLSETGAQPMWDAGRRACIAYNGEIYNYRELREECVRRGAELRGTSDTEVILNLFLLDGERAFARLNGMFAFCLFDARTGEAWLARDPMGIKPLYWAETEQGIAFASELGALLAGGLVPFEIDPAALEAYLQFDFVPSPLSIVRGVSKLPGGMLVHVGESISERQFSNVNEEATPHGSSAQEDVDRFDAVMRAAVQRHLVADVPVGVFLSGGIDSSIVAQVARDAAGRVSTFSIAFDDPSFDESPWFDEAARVIGSDHHTERLTTAAMLDLLPDVARVVSEPLADGSIFPTMLLSRFTRRHVKVALSGDGADELFAGYPTHALIRAGRTYALLPPFVRRAISQTAHAILPVSHANLSVDFKVKKFLDGADRDALVQNAQWLGTFRSDDLVTLRREDAEGSLTSPQSFVNRDPSPLRRLRMTALELILRHDRRRYLQDGVLVKVDRASMASALEVRVPMLDHELVRFANGLPADRKIRRGQSKWILREWARRHFPPSITDRPKKGFGAPLGQWFRGPLRELVRDTLAPEGLARDGFFRPDAVQRIVEEHERGARDQRKRIFNLLMFTLWYRQFRA